MHGSTMLFVIMVPAASIVVAKGGSFKVIVELFLQTALHSVMVVASVAGGSIKWVSLVVSVIEVVFIVLTPIDCRNSTGSSNGNNLY